MANLCKGASLPPMTVPFNLIDLLLFICLPSTLTHLAPTDVMQNATIILVAASSNDSIVALNATNTELVVDWIMVCSGIRFYEQAAYSTN